MNEIEHLLSVVGEEGAEVTQAASKANRFGLMDGYPNTDRTNAGDLLKEFAQLEAVIEMLEERGALTRDPDQHAADKAAKKRKVEQFMAYARDMGTLV